MLRASRMSDVAEAEQISFDFASAGGERRVAFSVERSGLVAVRAIRAEAQFPTTALRFISASTLPERDSNLRPAG